MKTFKELSDDTLRALYLAVCAGRKETTSVLISNKAQNVVFGTAKGRRLSDKRIRDFADTLKPVFPRRAIKVGRYGQKYLILYLNEKDDSSVQTKPARVFIPSQSTIYEPFGI